MVKSTCAGACALVLMMASPAVSAELPRYDVNAYCQDVSEFGGGSSMLFNSCIEMEQKAYNGIKAAWSGLPQRVQAYCHDVAGFGGGSYMLLESCVDMELSASRSTPSFEY